MAFKVFISYSHRDQVFRQELDKHLSNLKRQNIISSWYDGDIPPGTEWQPQIMKELNSAEIILLLVSADFMASDFCYSIELTQAIARHEAREAVVIPIILRPTDWEGAPFAKLNMLPTNAKAISLWSPRDKAFNDVVQGIKQALAEAPPKRSSEGGEASVAADSQITASASGQAAVSTWDMPEMGKTFLSKQDRNWIINLVDTLIEPMLAAGIKNLLRGKLPDAQINRINFREGSRNIAENIIGNLEPRGALDPGHYHALGAFLKDLIEEAPDSHEIGAKIVVLLFRYRLVSDRTAIEKLSEQFQVPS